MRISTVEAFAQFVRGERVRMNWTQEELARAVGKSRRWVHDLEAGKVAPSLSAVVEVSAALGHAVEVNKSERSPVLDAVFEALA